MPVLVKTVAAVGGLDRPVDVGDRLAAGLADQLERDLRRLVVERRVGQLARLDLEVGAHDGVHVAEIRDDVIGAGVERDDVVGAEVLRDQRPVGVGRARR